MYKNKRCHYFNNYGQPIDNGCPRTSSECRFVHPDEPDWNELPPVPPFRSRRRTFDFSERPRSPHRSGGLPPPLASRISPRQASGHGRDRSPEYSSRRRSPSPIRSPISPKASRFEPAGPTPNQESNKLRESAARMPQPTVAPSSTTVSMPLPLLPIPPILLSVKQPPRADLSFEQKRKAWADRIQLLAESLQQRAELIKLDEDIHLMKRLTLLTLTGPVAEASKAASEAKLMTLESKRKEAMEKYDVLFNRVTTAENWPLAVPVDDEHKDALSKAIKYCEELSRSTEEINRVLTRSTSVVTNGTYAGDPNRSLKRRRVDEGGKDEQQEPQVRLATPEGLEELSDRALAIQETITNIQNYQDTIRNDLAAEYKEQIESKVEDATAEVVKSVKVVEGKVQYIESNIKASEDDLKELAGDVEKLILDNQSFHGEIERTHQRIKETEARVAQVEHKLQELTDGRAQFANAILALKAAHDAHVAKPSSPPVSPILPSMDYIVTTAREPLLDAARSAITPLLLDAKKDVQELITERNAELYKTLWNRLSLTLKVVDTISARLAPSNGGDVGPTSAS